MTEQEKSNNKYASLVSALAGTCGSSVAKVFVHPIDTIKAKLQVKKMETHTRGSLIADIARKTIQTEGIGGLYRGFAICFFGSIPGAALYYGSYEFFKKNTLQNSFFQQHPNLSYLAGGMFAEAVACILFVPVDVIKERRQVQANMGTFNYKNDLDAIR